MKFKSLIILTTLLTTSVAFSQVGTITGLRSQTAASTRTAVTIPAPAAGNILFFSGTPASPFDIRAFAGSDIPALSVTLGKLGQSGATLNQVPSWNGAAWVPVAPGSGTGDVATDAIWDAAGDIVQGTGANTAARLAIGTANQILQVNAGATALEYTGAPTFAAMNITGALAVGSIELEGATADAFETALVVVDPTADRTITFPNATGTVVITGQQTDSFVIAISDETTAITTGTAKVTFRAPYAFTITGVRASLTTVSSSGLPTFDINEAGVTVLSTKITVDASEKTSTTAAAAAVVSDTAIADDAEITIDIDVAGTGATGAKIYITHQH